jgi:succinyl-diaminopimelate desuccinylase
LVDLLSLAAELVDVSSVSHHEGALADLVEARLRRRGHLDVERVGDSVVGRTLLGRQHRLVFAGHLDTVPPFDANGPRLQGDTLWGLGAVDMKGGLAVLLDLADTEVAPAMDATFVFYACEEVAHRHNALARLVTERPELVCGEAAVLGEPTASRVEAGCQGTLRAAVSLAGRRAHTARPWAGVNAVHRLEPALARLVDYKPRRVTIDGCEYVEQLQAVAVEGGVAANVVPDRATLTVNYRFAPDRDVAGAQTELERLLQGTFDDVGDHLEVLDVAAGAPPCLDHPILASLVACSGQTPRAKVGWTDVATFWAVGTAATNFGPGDPILAHTPDEHVSRKELETARAVLARVLAEPVRADAGR